MPRLAKDITVSMDKGRSYLVIDGEELPYYVRKDDMPVTISPDGLHELTVTFLFDGNFRAWSSVAEQPMPTDRDLELSMHTACRD